MKRLAVLLGLVLVALGLLGVSSAAVVRLAGDLDPSFGSGGVVTHILGSNANPSIGSIAVQPDGKIVVAAGSLLARYLPNGSPDPSFGDGGYVQTPSTYSASAEAIAVQPDGKIVVAGNSTPPDANAVSQFMLARYNPDGSLDTSFGTDGVTNTAFPELGMPWSAAANALAILPDGKIVAAGTAGWGSFGPCFPPSMFALARYTPEGTLDPTFGDGGLVQTAFFGQDQLAGIAIQRDGKIVASGTGAGANCALRHRLGRIGAAPGITAMAVASYEPDGSLDPSFGGGDTGTWTTGAIPTYSGGPPVIQHGKIFVTGTQVLQKRGLVLVIVAFQKDGYFDSALGQDGIARIPGITGQPTAVLAQRDGKVLILLSSGALVRLLPNGRLDPSFGSRGIVSLPLYQASSLALQPDRKVLVGGGGSSAWWLARLIGGNNCVVPGLRGKTVSKASATLTKSYCRRGRISKRFSGKVTRGQVISTAPPRGARRHGGAKVDLVVSKGKRP